jgi:hypothetical protein
VAKIEAGRREAAGVPRRHRDALCLDTARDREQRETKQRARASDRE